MGERYKGQIIYYKNTRNFKEKRLKTSSFKL